MKKKTTVKITVWTAVLAAAAVGIWLTVRPSGGGDITLQTAVAARGDIRNSVTATGTVEPVTLVEVGTQVSGIIDRLYVDYNDRVTAGQLIAEMDKVTLESDLEEAEAQLASSKTEYEYRMKEYLRTKQLYDKELVSDAEYDEALYLYETARNTYAQRQASIVGIRRNLGYATITSPIDGVVISRAVEEGQTVAAGFETPTLFTIANDLTDMQVIADVDEADIGYVQEGQRVDFTVDAYPDDVFSGTVKQVRLEATTESSVVTYEVVITAYNPELKLKPRLTANISIYTVERDSVLCIPSKALLLKPEVLQITKNNIVTDCDSPKKVWTKSGNTFTAIPVVVGINNGTEAEIISGIEEGTEVVTEAVLNMKNFASDKNPGNGFMPGPHGRK